MDKITEFKIENKFRDTIQIKTNEIDEKTERIRENDKNNESKLLKLFADSVGYKRENLVIKKKHPKDPQKDYIGHVVVSEYSSSFAFLFNSPDAPLVTSLKSMLTNVIEKPREQIGICVGVLEEYIIFLTSGYVKLVIDQLQIVNKKEIPNVEKETGKLSGLIANNIFAG
ncbi:hypothetical protein [Leptospira stimsonii]|nr:hypothetical protein [Leptospira stimsonii]